MIADGGYRGTRLTIPHYRRHKDEELSAWKDRTESFTRLSPGPAPGDPHRLAV
ncbi:hypothetical protein ACH4A3_09425 [Streptomyces sp. NPDC018007]|uniref:hypothetical protein n=1 Tax=Streptomyces sp. NPDC018007 TaxID=3365029 RepID=UPI0037B1159C